MKKLVITKYGGKLTDISESEKEEFKVRMEMQYFEESLKPSKKELEDADFNLKTINLLTEMGML